MIPTACHYSAKSGNWWCFHNLKKHICFENTPHHMCMYSHILQLLPWHLHRWSAKMTASVLSTVHLDEETHLKYFLTWWPWPLTYDLDLITWPRYSPIWLPWQNSCLYVPPFGWDSETDRQTDTHTQTDTQCQNYYTRCWRGMWK